MVVDVDLVRAALARGPTNELSGERVKRRAAVAAVLRPIPRSAGGLEVLFIKRTEREGDPWSGHMAFPGGRHDERDEDLVRTAVRETREELGLALDDLAEPLGRLDDVPATARGLPTGLVVTPFVWLLREVPAMQPDPSEVAEVHWAPLEPLFRGERDTHIEYPWQGQVLKLPGYEIDGGALGRRVVWGLTHRMLQIFFARLRADGS